MYITVDSFMLCAYAKGYEMIKGFEDWEEGVDFNGAERSMFTEDLIESGMLQIATEDDNAEGTYIISPLGQLYMEIMSSPESWLKISNLSSGNKRLIYAKDFYFLCVDVRNETMSILLLLTIEHMVGAYASMWPAFSTSVPIREAKNAWNTGNPVYELNGESAGQELSICICDNGSVQKSLDKVTDYDFFTEETYTNAVTKWMLSGICAQ